MCQAQNSYSRVTGSNIEKLMRKMDVAEHEEEEE